MKNLLTLLLFISLLTWGQKVQATAQIPVYLIKGNDTLAIFSNPLESYFESRTRPDSLFAAIGYTSTACWRGYVAYWELENDKLYLLEVHGPDSTIDLSLIFDDRNTQEKVFADWFSHTIHHPYGKLVHYEHMGYGSIYAYEKAFDFDKGILTATKTYDNSKSRKSPYSQNQKLLNEFLHRNIDYSNITDEPYKKAHVFVQIHSVTAAGKIDSVSVIHGFDEERDREAIRVIKSIPEWDVLYSRGKLYQLRWTIRLMFGADE